MPALARRSRLRSTPLAPPNPACCLPLTLPRRPQPLPSHPHIRSIMVDDSAHGAKVAKGSPTFNDGPAAFAADAPRFTVPVDSENK